MIESLSVSKGGSANSTRSECDQQVCLPIDFHTHLDISFDLPLLTNKLSGMLVAKAKATDGFKEFGNDFIMINPSTTNGMN